MIRNSFYAPRRVTPWVAHNKRVHLINVAQQGVNYEFINRSIITENCIHKYFLHWNKILQKGIGVTMSELLSSREKFIKPYTRLDIRFEKFDFKLNYKENFFVKYPPVTDIKSEMFKKEVEIGFFATTGMDGRQVFKFLINHSYEYIWTEFIDVKSGTTYLVGGYLITGNRFYISKSKRKESTEAFKMN